MVREFHKGDLGAASVAHSCKKKVVKMLLREIIHEIKIIENIRYGL